MTNNASASASEPVIWGYHHITVATSFKISLTLTQQQNIDSLTTTIPVGSLVKLSHAPKKTWKVENCKSEYTSMGKPKCQCHLVVSMGDHDFSRDDDKLRSIRGHLIILGQVHNKEGSRSNAETNSMYTAFTGEKNSSYQPGIRVAFPPRGAITPERKI